MVWSFVTDNLRHDSCRDRRQQNAIAKMSRGDEISWRFRRSQDRQIIRGPGPQARPRFQNASLRQSRHQTNGGLMQAMNRSGIDALVVSDVLDRGADQNSSIAAWHQVNFGCTDHMTYNRLPYDR